ncbi:jg8202 [Pararge aegeria aegeria]|uniref:Jg8202 protein n=1 Tax=Pararge aegeria aegeria TaxID=348720 RepID=A0A8S4SNE3_9NEOP|nr:jg8202 [Pararge aegeria aegeria]
MDYPFEHESCFRQVFRTFVCVVLSLLLGLQVYSYFLDPQEALEGDFTDIKYMVMQLTRGLSEVNRKHESLQGEMERISEALPAVAAAAGRAKDALEPSRRSVRHPLDVYDYDRQVIMIIHLCNPIVVETGLSIIEERA